MLFPTLATTLTFVTLASASSASNRIKRQNSAASAALALNTALATQICVIAQGVFSASAALGGQASLSGCAALLALPVPAKVKIDIFGCSNLTQSTGSCPPGYLTPTGMWSIDTPHTGYSIYNLLSSDGTCAGIKSPFVIGGTTVGSSLYNVGWNINCTSQQITLADTTTHLCYFGGDYQVDGVLAVQPASNTCVNPQTFYAGFNPVH